LGLIAITLRPKSQSPLRPQIQVFCDSSHRPNQQFTPIAEFPRARPAGANEYNAVQLAIGCIGAALVPSTASPRAANAPPAVNWFLEFLHRAFHSHVTVAETLFASHDRGVLSLVQLPNEPGSTPQSVGVEIVFLLLFSSLLKPLETVSEYLPGEGDELRNKIKIPIEHEPAPLR
jgi:hypothetical protein